eukprot:s1801_g2.t1
MTTPCRSIAFELPDLLKNCEGSFSHPVGLAARPSPQATSVFLPGAMCSVTLPCTSRSSSLRGFTEDS